MSQQHIKVLLAEDQGVIRNAIKKYLEKDSRFEVLDCNNGVDAKKLLAEHSDVDVVLLDLYMPRQNGFDVLNHLRSRTFSNDIPVLIISGEATKADIVQCIDFGTDNYILKPFEMSDFSAKLNKVLDEYFHPPPRLFALRKAEKLLLQERYDEAEIILNQLGSEGERSPRLLTSLAQILIKKGQKPLALGYLKESIKSNPMYFPAYQLASSIHESMGNISEAISFIEKELKVHTKQPDQLLKLAELFFLVEKYAEGIKWVHKALSISPHNEPILIRMAEMQAESGNLEKAFHYYQKLRRINPSSQHALKGILDLSLKVNNPKKAYMIFCNLINMSPHKNDLYLARAKACVHMENYEGALADLKRCHSSLKDRPEFLKVLAKVHIKMDDMNKAVKVWKKIVQMEPEGKNYAALALVCLKMSDFAQAERLYEQAITRCGENLKYHYNLAVCREELGKHELAFKGYSKVAKLHPEYEAAQDGVDRLSQLLGARKKHVS